MPMLLNTKIIVAFIKKQVPTNLNPFNGVTYVMNVILIQTIITILNHLV